MSTLTEYEILRNVSKPGFVCSKPGFNRLKRTRLDKTKQFIKNNRTYVLQ